MAAKDDLFLTAAGSFYDHNFRSAALEVICLSSSAGLSACLYAELFKLEIWGTAQRAAARRRKSDWGDNLWG